MTSRDDLISTFHRLEDEARAAFTKETGVHGSLMGVEEITECARRAADLCGWPRAKAFHELGNSFANLTG